MSFKSVPAKNAVVRVFRVMTVTVAALISVRVTSEPVIRAQPIQVAVQPKLHLPDEAAGLDAIVRTLISAFDQVDVVALGEDHGEKRDSDLRIALVRHPDFAKKVRTILVEFGTVAQQPTLDRYIRGENVPQSDLEQVWKTTQAGNSGAWNSAIYADFFAAVRDVNDLRAPFLRDGLLEC
jgi:hypothetical protein